MKDFDRLIEIVDILRSEKGCAWDRSRTLEDLRGYLLEETYELVDALQEKKQEQVKEELGDVFLLLVFIIKMFMEDNLFSVEEVLQAINAKLISRHPHVFAGKKVKNKDEIVAKWVKAKAREKKRKNLSQRLPKSAPALLLASLFYKELRYLGRDDCVFEVREKIRKSAADLDGSGRDGPVLLELILECACLASLSGIDLENDLRQELHSRAKALNYK